METQLESILTPFIRPGISWGIIGAGNFGLKIRDFVEGRGVHTLLCDPPRSMDDIEELDETFQQIWGNGMGGCQLSNAGLETFLPLTSLKSAQVISIHVPLTTTGRWPTHRLISPIFAASCKPDAAFLCFSEPAVVAPQLRNDPRFRFFA